MSNDRLTDQECVLVAGIASGMPIKEAARQASYPDNAPIYRIVRGLMVRNAIKEAREALLLGDIASTALETMTELMGKTMPAATRFAAAKWVLEGTGLGPAAEQPGKGDKPLNEMSNAELAKFLADAQRVMDQGGERPVITVAPKERALNRLPRIQGRRKTVA